MLKMKKGVLVFLVALALFSGIVVTVAVQFVCDFSIGGKLAQLISGKEEKQEYVLSKAEYENYEYLSKTYANLDAMRRFISKNFYQEVDDNELDIWTYKGLLAGLNDPYSTYYTDSEFEQIMISTTGEYSGIGVTISVGDNGYVEVVAVTEGAPAERSGIKPGDYIMSVDGVEYLGSQLDLASAKIRGKAGTDVTLTVFRDGEYIDFTITREDIIAVSIKYEMLDGNIGHIRILGFEENTADDFKSALRQLEKDGAEALIIDLRDNGGGLVDSCVEIADQLLDKATVAYAEDRDGNREYFTTVDGKTKLPYVVLINGNSASASEILACGIQDNGGGPVIGTRSYGKGIIQSLDRWPYGGAIKLTVLQYFSPSGKVIHKEGVAPDLTVELTEDCYDDEGNLVKDLQLEKALELLN